MSQSDKRPTLLLIEDDAATRELLAQEFKSAGIETVVAKDAREGLEKFRETKPDIIVLDIVLPDLNGFEFLRNIRKEPGGAEMKVVILSNVAEHRDVEEAKELGALDYLVKTDFSLPQVVEKVESILRK